MSSELREEPAGNRTGMVQRAAGRGSVDGSRGFAAQICERRLLDLFSDYGMFFMVGLLILISAALSPGFLSSKNLLVLSRQAAMLGIVAIGQTFVILVGGIDLSVASVMAVASVVSANLMAGQDSRTLPIALLCLAIASLVGLVNGVMITKLKIAPFIATLGMILIVQGGRFLYTGGAPKGSIPPALRFFGRGMIGPIPAAVVAFAFTATVAFIVLRKTTFGRQVYAVGGNSLVAHLSGVNVDRVVVTVYVICSFLAGVAGLVLTGYIGMADNWLGQGYELDSIAAVVVGGTAFEGGRGGVIGTIAGVLIIAILFNLVLRLVLPEETQRVIKGLVILTAVSFYTATSRN